MVLANLTGHSITLEIDGWEYTFPPDGFAQLTGDRNEIRTVSVDWPCFDDSEANDSFVVAVLCIADQRVAGLPNPADNTVYIVSNAVGVFIRESGLGNERKDVVMLGGIVRRAGVPVAARHLIAAWTVVAEERETEDEEVTAD